MLKLKLHFAIIILVMCITTNLTNDLYSKFHQKDYKIDFQRTELISYEKSAFSEFEIRTFKLNRTFPAVNVTLNSKRNMSTEVELVVEMYKFLSNQYRIFTGTRFRINLCKTFKANLGGIQVVFKCGNMKSCKFCQGITYKICNVYPDESRFPPFLPNGEYKFQLEMLYIEETIATIATFIKVYRPIVVT